LPWRAAIEILSTATRFTFFLRILITLSRPALMTVSILAFVTIWNAHLLALLTFTTPLALHAAAGSGDICSRGG